MIECNIPYDIKNERGKNQYVSIFPTDKKYEKTDSMQVEEFAKKVEKSKKSNLHEMITYLCSI